MESRKDILTSVRSVVIKLGTQLLADKDGRLDAGFVSSIAQQVATLRERKIAVSIVSSGAIGAGVRELNLARRPTDLAKLQAVAAVGQRRLMDVWADAFEPFGVKVAQMLLTREDINARTRYLNLRNTIFAAYEMGAVPIINENDTVSTDELTKITFGDNDILAALVTNALPANLLVLLTVVDGLLDPAGKRVPIIHGIDEAQALVRAEKSVLGKGGMDSKLKAAKMVTGCGETLVVADGRMPDVLTRLLDGDDVGTLFVPSSSRRPSRARWIGAAHPAGTIVIDDGAVAALVQKNKSLLPIGITRVDGDFACGDVVAIQTTAGRTVARGLTNYDAADLERVRGKKTAEVRALMKDAAYDEVVHRDNLVID